MSAAITNNNSSLSRSVAQSLSPSPRPRFYSQHGEDVVAYKALGRSRGPRFFVEVGMIDGRCYSNTLAFEEQGWRGVCIEPHPVYAPLVTQNRPGSRVFHAAAGSAPGRLPFYADARGDLSGLAQRDEAQMKQRFGRWFNGFQTIDVPVRRLDDMLMEAGAPQNIELISIDVEGTELDVLAGLDLNRWRPRVLIVEGNDAASRAALDAHFARHGYFRGRQVVMNVFYARNPVDALRLRLATIDQPLVHTRHPIDPPGSEKIVPPPTNQAGPVTTIGNRIYEGLAWRLARRSRFFEQRWSAHCNNSRFTRSTNPRLSAAAGIPGWLRYEEAAGLYDCVMEAPAGNCLEIGSFCGRSSVVLAGALADRPEGSRLWCCDPFTGAGETAQQKSQQRLIRRLGLARAQVLSTFDAFMANTDRAGLRGRIVVFAATSEDAVPVTTGDFAVAFVDGWHDYEHTRRDALMVRDRILPGGFLVFHDYSPGCPGVVEAVREVIETDPRFARVDRQAGSLAIFRRLP